MKLRDIVALLFFKVRTTCSPYCVWHCYLAAKLKSEICATLIYIDDIFFILRIYLFITIVYSHEIF